jgi:predicted nuclease with TOPRIM domain
MNKKYKVAYVRIFGTMAIGVAMSFFVVSLGIPAFADNDVCDEEMTDEECEAAKIKAKEEEEKAEKEREKLQEEEEETRKKLEKEEQELQAHTQTLSSIQSSLSATVNQIKQTEAVIETTEQTIARKEGEIVSLEKRLDLQKTVLGNLLQEWYRTSFVSSAVAVFADGGLVHIAQAGDATGTVGERMRTIIDEIEQTKEKVVAEKADLEGVKEEKARLLAIKEQQAAQLEDSAEYQATKVAKSEAEVAKLREKLAELKSDIAKLTGKSYSTDDIREAVEFASKHTRVPKSVLYGFLGAETRFNANTGQCTYKQVKKDAIDLWYGKSSKWKDSRDLLEKRMDIFYDIVDELGYSKDKKVSCTPRSYRGQGGAMGVSQFMSDTWRGYESEIRKRTGSKQPNPWDLVDGITAMALKLEKAGATSESKSKVKTASASYLGAFNQSYYNNILYWMENYEDAF